MQNSPPSPQGESALANCNLQPLRITHHSSLVTRHFHHYPLHFRLPSRRNPATLPSLWHSIPSATGLPPSTAPASCSGVHSPIATELEITALADREMKRPGGGKALLIEHPTVNGQTSPFPVAINTLGSWRRLALAMGAESVDHVAAELGSLVRAKPPTSFSDALNLLRTALDLRHAKPKLVQDGPCKEVIHRFDAPPTRTEPWPSAPTIPDPRLRNSGQPPSGSGTSVTDQPPSLGTSHSPFPTLLSLPILQCWPLDGGRFITLPCVVTKRPRHRRTQCGHVSHPGL